MRSPATPSTQSRESALPPYSYVGGYESGRAARRDKRPLFRGSKVTSPASESLWVSLALSGLHRPVGTGIMGLPARLDGTRTPAPPRQQRCSEGDNEIAAAVSTVGVATAR